MEKVTVRHIGKAEFRLNHGDVVEIFAPGEVREVPAYVAESLLREEAVKRNWRKDGAFRSEARVRLFEEVLVEEVE